VTQMVRRAAYPMLLTKRMGIDTNLTCAAPRSSARTHTQRP